MKTIYIKDERGSSPQIIDIDNTLETFYKLLNCRMIEMPTRRIGNKYYDIICDEEGLFGNKTPTAVTFDGEPDIGCEIGEYLVGSILIVNHDDEGNTVGLTDEDIDNILNAGAIPTFCTAMITRKDDNAPETRKMLCCSW